MLQRASPILKIAGPMVLANLSVPLLGLVDTAILGHLENASTLAAAALGAYIISLLFWSFGFLRMSTTGLTSRLFGAEDHAEVKATLARALIIAGLISLAVVLISQPILGPMAQWLSDSGPIGELSTTYMEIRIWSAPATLATYCFIGWFIGLGKSKSALLVLVAVNLANALLDYWLIVILQMGISGAAYASVAAEYLGLVVAGSAALLILKQPSFVENRWSKLFDRKKLLALLQANFDLFLRTLSLLLVFLIVTAAGVRISPEVAAANAILLNLLSFSAHAMDGFAYAAESLCGRAWGKKDFREFWLIAKESTLFALAVGVSFVAVFLLLQQPILHLYTDLPEVIASANQTYIWLALLPLIAIWCYQLDGIFIGIGNTQSMRNAMLFSFLVVFLPTFFATRDIGPAGIWIALWAFHLARVVGLVIPLKMIFRAQENNS